MSESHQSNKEDFPIHEVDWMLSVLSHTPGMAYRGRNEEGWPMEWVSSGSLALLGLDAETFLESGGRFEELIVAPDREKVRQEVRRAVERAEPFHCIYRIRSARGEVRWVSDHGVATAGASPRIEGFIADVTAVKELEQKLERSRRLEALGELAGSLAHDFNNVLTVVIAGAEASLASIRGGGEEDVEKNLVAALEAAIQAASLTRQLLAVARQSPVEVRREELDVCSWLAGSLDSLALTAGSGIHVRMTSRATLARVRVDRDRLMQALLNLVLNARDAMGGAGELLVHCDVTPFDDLPLEGRSLLAPGRYVTIAVRDSGPGIPADRLSRVFEPFYTSKPEGTGLGLATVYSFARQHDGLATADSARGEGATFRLYLPAAGPSD